MKLSQVFAVNTVVNFLYGVAFVVIPVPLVALYGVELSPGGVAISRLFGAALIGVGGILWRLRAAPPEVAHWVALPLFVSSSIGFVVYVQAMLAGSIAALGWGVVALYGAFSALYGYFAFAPERLISPSGPRHA